MIHDLPLFVAAALLLNLTPGPDMLYVMGTAAARGARAGVAAALGIGAGCGLHIALGAVGVSALVAASPLGFALLKMAGAAYLMWAGLSLWRRRGPALETAPSEGSASAVGSGADASAWRVFPQGALVNALNPKVALFFLALLPQFIDAQAASPTAQAGAFVALGLLFDVGGTLVNLGVALGAARLAQRLQGVRRGIDRLAGVLFVGLGLKLALGARA